MSAKEIVPGLTFFEEVRAILAEARQKAYAAVNFAMVEAYWEIGRRIVEEEQKGKGRADYGTFLIKELSKQLTAEFGKGFAVANLRNFRQFYLIFPEFPKRYAARSVLTWSHYRLIMRVDNTEAREYYIHEATEQSWSTRQLERNINTLYYERLLKSSGKKELAQKSGLGKNHFSEFIKDPYVLEFLKIPESPSASEREIETALKDSEQLFASKYRLILPTEEELVKEIERERRMIMEQRGLYEVNHES